MLQDIIEKAGYTVISLESRQCLLDCVENLQKQRDQLRGLLHGRLALDEALEEHY